MTAEALRCRFRAAIKQEIESDSDKVRMRCQNDRGANLPGKSRNSGSPSLFRWLWGKRQLVTRNKAFAPFARMGLRSLSWLLRGRNLQLRNPRIRQLPYLNVGSGPRLRPEAINLDYSWYPGIDLVWDATKRLPFTDCRFKGVFTEHCLPHIPFERVQALLNEVFRVLDRGGVLRIVVPDGGFYIDLYSRAVAGETVQFPFLEDALDWTPMMKLKWAFRPYFTFVYDFHTLERMLRKAGFSEVTRESFRRGHLETVRFDSSDRQCESLYVEGLK